VVTSSPTVGLALTNPKVGRDPYNEDGGEG